MSAGSGAEREEPRFKRTREALAGKGTEAQGEPASGSLSGAAERIRQMLVTAEDVSEDIRREATEEAERYLAERRREADALVAARREHLEQALETLRSEGREIERRVTAVAAALERALADPLVSEPSAPAPPASEATVEPVQDPEPAESPAPEQPKQKRRRRGITGADSVPPPAAEQALEDEARETDGKSAAASAHSRQRALIRATQLAVQGADRDAVQRKLDEEFELDDTASIVEEILGSD